MLYSKTTGGFYDSTLGYSTIPADAVSISLTTYQNLMAGQGAGQTITADANGNPILVTPSSLWTTAQQWADYQNQAMMALRGSDITMHRLCEAVGLGLTTFIALDAVAFINWRRQLRAILSQPQPATIPTSLPTKPAWPVGT